MVPVVYGAMGLYRGYSLLKKGYKIAKPFVGRHLKSTWKDIKGSYKHAKTKVKRGIKAQQQIESGKPLTFAQKRLLAQPAPAWSKEGGDVAKYGLLGYVAHETYTADYGEDELKPKKEENGDNGKKIVGTTKPAGIDPKKKLESNTSADTPGTVVAPEANEKSSGDKGSEQIVVPSITGTNIKVPYTKYKPQAYSQYFVGRDAPNEAYNKLQSEGLKRYNPQNLERKRKYLRSL